MARPSQWNLWFNRRGRLKGIAIVYYAADYGLEMQPNGLTETDRIAWCRGLCAVLNKHGPAIRPISGPELHDAPVTTGGES